MKSQLIKWSALGFLLLVVVGSGFAFRDRWLPPSRNLAQAILRPPREKSEQPAAPEGPTDSLHLTPQARKNIGLRTLELKLGSYDKTISMPALVVERPGRSQVEVTAPLGGRVTRVYPVKGEAVMPGEPLFDVRLTHEELVRAQSELLRSAEEVDVIKREIKRLKSITVPGAIPGKTIREREYEQQKLEAVINSQKQSLELHGLTKEQVGEILSKRMLLQGMTVAAPPFSADGHHAGEADHPFHVQDLSVKPGQYVDAGARLCVLADHHELFIEGRAFEQDIGALHRLTQNNWTLSAATFADGDEQELIEGLKIFYLADVIDTDSRAFHFYLRLENQIVRDVKDEDHRFVSWRFKPGQRMQIQVPVERWEQELVAPVEAVAEDGVETYMFEQNGDHFDRIAVHVKHRGEQSVVIENDGRLLGGVFAANAADQLQMALKKQASGGGGGHHGHSH